AGDELQGGGVARSGLQCRTHGRRCVTKDAQTEGLLSAFAEGQGFGKRETAVGLAEHRPGVRASSRTGGFIYHQRAWHRRAGFIHHPTLHPGLGGKRERRTAETKRKQEALLDGVYGHANSLDEVRAGRWRRTQAP